MAAGDVLVTFVEAVLGDDMNALAAARAAVQASLGDAALVDVCATIASFNAVVKLADGTGIPLEPWKIERTADIRTPLGIEAYRR